MIHFRCFLSLVRQIERFPTEPSDRPTEPIVIADCGILSPDDPSLTEAVEPPKDGDKYEDYPEDEDVDLETDDGVQKAVAIAKDIREIGNRLFKEGKFAEARAKYESAFLSFRRFRSCCSFRSSRIFALS